MALDEFLPDYDFNEVHSTFVAASPEDVLAAARALTSREVRLLIALMSLRGLPAAIRDRRRWAPVQDVLDTPVLDHFTRAGFVVLADGPDELVVGGVGRFWTADGGIRRLSAAEFIAFDEPGFAKSALNFHTHAVSGGTVLTTETRIKATDDAARRSFGRYWRVVMPGSAAIRRAWLRAIRRRAELPPPSGRYA